MCVGVPEIRTGKRAKVATYYTYLAIGRRITYTPSVEAQLVEKRAKRCLSVWSYFADVMLTYKRYQALRAIHIRVLGEPGNEAMNRWG